MNNKANASDNADKPAKAKGKRNAKQPAPETQKQAPGNEGTAAASQPVLKEAQNSLAKLPIMGQALWLYARDPLKKFMFMADIDWVLLPDPQQGNQIKLREWGNSSK